eukprot:6888103-Alexandrium_andersonii.AAC.1
MTAANGKVGGLPVGRAKLGVLNAERPGDPACALLLDEVDRQTVVAPRKAGAGRGWRGEGNANRRGLAAATAARVRCAIGIRPAGSFPLHSVTQQATE